MKIYKLLFFSLLLISFFSCKETDDTPPFITMKFADNNSNDSTIHILNQLYVDPGATAMDDTDGDITSSIFVDNQVNENLVGWYSVTYNVVDQAGNEARPASRWVYVYNEVYDYWEKIREYGVEEQKVFPQTETYQYTVGVFADTLVNQRLSFTSMAGDLGQAIYADITDSLIVIPFQIAQYDSVNSYSIQGSGFINDTLIILDYTKIDSVKSIWNSELNRMK